MTETAKRQMEAIKEIAKIRELADSAHLTQAEADARIAELRKVR